MRHTISGYVYRPPAPRTTAKSSRIRIRLPFSRPIPIHVLGGCAASMISAHSPQQKCHSMYDAAARAARQRSVACRGAFRSIMMVGNSRSLLLLLATLLGSFASGALGALVDRSTLRTVSVTGGGAENPSLFHMVRLASTPADKCLGRECGGLSSPAPCVRVRPSCSGTRATMLRRGARARPVTATASMRRTQRRPCTAAF